MSATLPNPLPRRPKTGSAAVPVEPAPTPPATAAERDAAAAFALAEKAESTRRAYGTDFARFRAWCVARNACALPAQPETVAAYLAAEASRAKPSTLNRRLAAIRYAHRLSGHPTPTADERLRAVMRGIRRSRGTAPQKKAPATAERLLAMLPAGDTLVALRDRALLLLGFAGAFRRSELVALEREDIAEVPEGLRITIRRSKTDPEARSAVIAIPRGTLACPVAALSAWLAAAGIGSGPVFRPIARNDRLRDRRLTDRSVAAIVKTHAARAGLDPRQYAGHSLRSGFLTSAAARGASLFKLADQSRHKSLEVLRGYVRDAELFVSHAGSGLL
jgi:site-specific recombinase XerD